MSINKRGVLLNDQEVNVAIVDCVLSASGILDGAGIKPPPPHRTGNGCGPTDVGVVSSCARVDTRVQDVKRNKRLCLFSI